jgi:glycyl-tRNA synthetase
MEIKRRNLGKFGTIFGMRDLEDVKALIEELEIACPESGLETGQVRQFNLMFGTN